MSVLNLFGSLLKECKVDGSLNFPYRVPDAATLVLTREDSGKEIILPDLTADIAITLPSPEFGLNFTFTAGGVLPDAQDWVISTGADANFYLGGLLQVDDLPAADSIVPDGNSNSILSVLTPEPGTRFKMVCDGLNWILSGTVVSLNAPTFADQP